MLCDTEEVLEFIRRRWPSTVVNLEEVWNNGNCYWFAYILVTRFSYLKIYYNPIEGHFVAGDGKKFFDVNGEYESDNLVLFEEIEKFDDLYYNRLIRDCVL